MKQEVKYKIQWYFGLNELKDASILLGLKRMDAIYLIDTRNKILGNVDVCMCVNEIAAYRVIKKRVLETPSCVRVLLIKRS